MLTDAQLGTINLMVSTEGVWAYQFNGAQKQAMAKLIAGKKKSEVQALLLAQQGAELAEIQFSGYTLPIDVSRIVIVVRSVQGV